MHIGEYRIDKASQDQNPILHFINKKNEVIDKSFYPQFADPIQSKESLEVLNEEAGLNIDKDTAASHWQGDKMDVYYGVEILFSLD